MHRDPGLSSCASSSADNHKLDELHRTICNYCIHSELWLISAIRYPNYRFCIGSGNNWCWKRPNDRYRSLRYPYCSFNNVLTSCDDIDRSSMPGPVSNSDKFKQLSIDQLHRDPIGFPSLHWLSNRPWLCLCIYLPIFPQQCLLLPVYGHNGDDCSRPGCDDMLSVFATICHAHARANHTGKHSNSIMCQSTHLIAD